MIQLYTTKYEALKSQYFDKFRTLKKEYDTFPKDKKVKVILANRNVLNLQLDTLEKIKYTKMKEVDRRVLEDRCNYLQKKIWIHEQNIYTLFHELSKYDPLKDKLENMIKAAGVLDWSDGVPDILTEMTPKESNALPPQDQIEILIAKRKLFDFECQAIEKELHKLFKKPNFKEFEKFWLVQHFYSLENKQCELYGNLCWLYFHILPIDYPDRKELREKILGSDVVFANNLLKRMLYDEEKDPVALWWNLQEIISLDRELQFIVRVLEKYSNKQILYEIDILEILKQSLPYVKEELENIPAELFMQRKEMLVEILKAETLHHKRYYYGMPME